jgi:poly(hydroxyalkanoate) depolymerase family esterase
MFDRTRPSRPANGPESDPGGGALASVRAINRQPGACSPSIGFERRGAETAAFRIESSERGAGTGSQQRASEKGPHFVSRTYTNHAGTREYKLLIPTAFHLRPLPLVVMLHGCNQTPDEFALATRMNALAEQKGFYVVYPAQPERANPARCWNWFDSSHQRRDQGEPAIVAGLVKHLVQCYCLDGKRVYVAGLSAGGAMAVILGRLYPDLFAAVGVHSGLPYAAAHDTRSAFLAMKRGNDGSNAVVGCQRCCDVSGKSSAIPTIVFHGDRDATVHPGNGLAVAKQSAGNSAPRIEADAPAIGAESPFARRVCARRRFTCTRFRTASEKVVVEQWLVHGGGHAWFGGDPREAYTDPEGPNASEEIIRFFFSHALESPLRRTSSGLRFGHKTACGTEGCSKRSGSQVFVE